MSTSPDETVLAPGRVVAGKYQLVEPCGRGSFGSVWSANHLTLGNTVAIKFLHFSVAQSPSARARFDREARISARLGDESLHVARVTDHGIDEGGWPFLVMELLRGESLEARLARERRLPLGLVATIVTQLCHALHAAHVAGVVHRDLKPANVFLCRGATPRDVHVKLLDFGVAKVTLDHDEQAITRAGHIVGTPAYMSPEQITAERFLDARTDLWAVVAMTYAMVVGVPPFGTGTILELGRRIVGEDPKRPTEIVPELPRELDAFVAHGLAKSKDARFQTTSDLAEALTRLAEGQAAGGAMAEAREVLHGATPSDDLRTREASSPRHSALLPDARGPVDRASLPGRPSMDWRPPRSSYVVPIVVALVLVIVGGLAAFLVRSAQRNVRPTSSATT